MVFYLNLVACVATIAFGLFGFLAPRFTASALDLTPTQSTMGLSEMRASVGGLFVASGIFAIIVNNPMAYTMIGIAFLGSVSGRILSLIFDAPPIKKVILFGGIEAALSAWLILGNIA